MRSVRRQKQLAFGYPHVGLRVEFEVGRGPEVSP